MSAPVKFQPAENHTVTPYLIVADGDAAIAWYTRNFGAAELFRIPMPGGRVGHAELRVGDSVLMLADENPQMGAAAPAPSGTWSVSHMVYVPDVDAVFRRAVADGATALRPVATHFYGDRAGALRDPFGHVWTVATHVEDVPPDELARRAAAFSG